MYSNNEFIEKNGTNVWNKFREIVKEYNEFAEINDLSRIKIRRYGETVRNTKIIFDEIFLDVPNEKMEETRENIGLPVRIYEFYKGIETKKVNLGYFTVVRETVDKILSLEQPMALCVYMMFKYHAKDQETEQSQKGETFVSAKRIAKRIGRSERYVQGMVKLLRDNKIIINDFKPGSKKPTRIIT